MKKVLLILIIILFSIPYQGYTKDRSVKELPLKYRKLLEEEVVYIISSREKDAFLQLETDRERELFIKAFWNHRDPTPGTLENEFNKEHYRRIEYVNHFFGRGIPKPGWKTDQGRIFILLGEPNDIQRIIGEVKLYNTEIWFYQGLAKYGLPPGFNLVFYQKGGVGEYVLYSPTSDGPQALMTSYMGDQANYLAAFRALKRINPELAQTSLSLIPGETARFGRPSLSSDILLHNISNLPQRQIKDMYVEKFLLYKDIVEVEYSANYIDNDSLIKVIKDPSGIYFVHYNVELKRFSVNLYQGKYSTNIKINGKISDLSGKTIYQYESLIPIELDETQMKKISYMPFDIYDMVPLLPGNYKLSILVKNEISKEFTSVEKDITIPQDDSFLRMGSLILGYKMVQTSLHSKNLMPFSIGHYQVYCDPQKIFLSKEKLILIFQIFGSREDLVKRGLLKYTFLKDEEEFFSIIRKVRDYQGKLNINEEFSLEKFPPGYYSLEVSLRDGDREILNENEGFEVSSVAVLARPWVYSRTLFPPSDPLYSFILGKQHFNKGEIEEARIQVEKAYQSRPDSVEYSLNLARIYLVLKEHEKIRAILNPFLNLPDPNYDVYLLLGEANQALSELDKAISLYNQAISHFGINIVLLNSLGECYFQLGQFEEASAVWKNSLKINPNQPELQKKLETLRK